MRFSKRFVVLLILISLMFFGSACQMRQKGRKPAPDWSRGLPLGVFVRGNVDLVVEQDGKSTHFVWLTQDEEEQPRIQYVQLDETAVTKINHQLDIPASQVRHPRLVIGNDDVIHFLWSSREEGERAWDLWYNQLDTTGKLQGESVQLAGPESDINDYDVITNGMGGLFVAWENNEEDSIYGAHIESNGTVVQSGKKLATGDSPSIQTDATGTLYMTWLSNNDVSYAQWAGGKLGTAVPTIITTLPESTGMNLDGPELGLAGEWAYILWSTYFSTGLQAGTAVAEYVSFPSNDPQIATPHQITISEAEDQTYDDYTGAYNLTKLAPPSDIRENTSFIREPKATTGQDDELAVALTMSQNFRLNAFVQVATALFKDGKYIGYQIAGKTEAFSQNPVLATDENGALYMAWRDGGRGTLAYYALTADSGQKTLNQMESNDIATVAMNGGVEVIAGVLFFPLTCVWLVPGLLIIGLYHFWKGESDLKEPTTIILLVISIAVSQLMKFLFLPTMTTYVPFSAWLDIPASWQDPMIIIIPVLTAVIGLIFAWFMHKRTESGLAFFFWFTAADAVLTLAIYGVNFLGVF